MIPLSPDHREAALFTSGFRRFALEQSDFYGFLREFRDYLALLQPEIIHVHHILNFGLESLFVMRETCPNARIILTLHDYYLICANNGHLYKHETRERCPGPSLDQCLKCFPDKSANDFAIRTLAIRNAFSQVDQLVSPSFFLKGTFERALEFDINIAVVENGYLGEAMPSLPSTRATDAVTFGYFGNISAVKGLGDLLIAAKMLTQKGINNFCLQIHGSQLDENRALSEQIEAAKTLLGDRISLFGLYRPEEMAERMSAVDCVVFPSLWWENAPLVLYEALHYGKQVVCYPHGGGPEILKRYGMGIFASRSDPQALAESIEHIVSDPSLTLQIPKTPIPGKSALFKAYSKLYNL
jgi:glycosyltransferase involved in cell wall biosynthesis